MNQSFTTLPLSDPIFRQTWLSEIERKDYQVAFDTLGDFLSELDPNDERLAITFREDKKTLSVIVGSLYAGGFHLQNGTMLLRFIVENKEEYLNDERFENESFQFNSDRELIYIPIQKCKEKTTGNIPI